MTAARILLLVCSLLLRSCMDVAQWQLRTFYGLDCRPEKLQNGNCVPTHPAPKGDNNVQKTAQP